MVGLLDGVATNTIASGLSSDLLAGWYGARASATLAASPIALASAARSDHKDIVPPWDVRLEQPTQDERLREALGGSAFVDEGATKLSSADASPSQQKLFALYAGLAKLSAIAGHAADKTTPEIMLKSLNARFADGLVQVLGYAATIQQSDLVVLPGDKSAKADADIRIPRQLSTYTTKVIHRAVTTDPMAQITGNETFTIAVAKGGATQNVDIDLADLGGGPVTFDQFIAFLNQRMADEGMVTRFKKERVFSSTRTARSPRPAAELGAQDRRHEHGEGLFLRPDAGPAVYLAGVSGKPGAGTAQMLKLDARGATPSLVTSARIEAVDLAAEGVAADAKAAAADPKAGTKSSSAPSPETDVGGSAIDADGNVYVVGTTEGSLGGEVLQGSSDVFLTKYDSAGAVVWQRMLGAADAADGASVAVDANGIVVIAGA
ncbi:MAG: hypothetical protein U1E87_06215 [Alphaproteobacteria bacterium]